MKVPKSTMEEGAKYGQFAAREFLSKAAVRRSLGKVDLTTFAATLATAYVAGKASRQAKRTKK